MDKKEKRLTQKQLDFCKSYVLLGNATEAYRQIYLPANPLAHSVTIRAYNLMRHPRIRKQLDLLRKKIDAPVIKKLQLSREKIIEDLLTAKEIAMGGRLVKVTVRDKETNSTKVIEVNRFDLTHALRALELLGKIDTIGLFVERSKVDVTGRFEAMSDEELDEFIASNGARLTDRTGDSYRD